tara:strand:+ start:523 stop:954 length:432 start_codon:yes stop_codon:yes gene_type:complete
METDNLHISEQELDLFLHLKPKDKIEFLYDAQFIGKDISIHNAVSKINLVKKNDNVVINELFQDTIYDEIAWGQDNMTVLIANNMLHLNSNSLKWIKKFISKLFSDGHIIQRNMQAKKIKKIDQYRFYRCYDIIGSGAPLCLN